MATATIAKCGIPVMFEGFLNPRTPQDVVVFFDDFLGSSHGGDAVADLDIWEQNYITTQATLATILDGTDAAEDEAGGVLVVTVDNTADEGINLQVAGEAFHLDGGYPLYFEARVNASSIVDIDWFIGISQADEEIITGGVSNRVGFESLIGTMSFISEDATNQKTVDTSITEGADDWIRLAFFWDGLLLHYAVDTNDNGEFEYKGYLTAATTADYVPQAIMMTPTIEAIVAATGGATLYVDYILVMQQRYSE
jgi:hypothetical protein